jgi:hypothetical protein
MAKKTKKKTVSAELDGVFVLKLVLYVVLGSLWLKIGHHDTDLQIPLPLGFALGLLLSSHEHFRIDRKIEYAVLVVAALFGFLAPYGLYINL